VSGATLRRAPAERSAADRPTARPTTLRIVRGPSTTLLIERHPVSVARVVRHGPADGTIAGPTVRHPSIEAVFARARALWPGLDARALARTHGDVHRIARLVSRRTALPEETIVAMLTATR
jgi:hypothetical protein